MGGGPEGSEKGGRPEGSEKGGGPQGPEFRSKIPPPLCFLHVNSESRQCFHSSQLL